METFNFLNKKYSSNHNNLHSASQISAQPLAHSRTSKATIHQVNHYASRLTTPGQINNNTNSSAVGMQMAANYCLSHSQQLIRHMCLDCIELLCSECVGDHIALHKQNKTYPEINTLKQLKTDMHCKLQEIMQFMFQQKNHPKNMMNNIDKVRQESSNRIDNLRKQIMEAVDLWIDELKTSVLNNVAYEQIKVIKQEMFSLHEQVNCLINALSQTNTNVHAIKKSYQIDANRLQTSYRQMISKHQQLKNTMKFQIQFSNNAFIDAIESAVNIKVGKKINKQVISIEEGENIVSDDQNHSPLKSVSLNEQKSEGGEVEEDFRTPSVLFNLPAGSNILSVCNLDEGARNIHDYSINNVLSYPLNSTTVLHNDIFMISGGMISEEKKNNMVQVYDYSSGSLLTQYQMKYGRSSHKIIPYKDRVFVVGGFCTETSQCKIVQVISGDGIKLSPHECKWGGPNLSIVYKKKLFKVTVAGVEVMDLQTLQWKQLLSDVPFALSKGMSIQKLNNQIWVFGDDQVSYKWDEKTNTFNEIMNGMQLGNINCSTVYQDKILAWMNNSKDFVEFDGKTWRWME